MVTYREFLSVALTECAPSGEGTGELRAAYFEIFAELWNNEKDAILTMSKSEIKDRLECPEESEVRSRS